VLPAEEDATGAGCALLPSAHARSLVLVVDHGASEKKSLEFIEKVRGAPDRSDTLDRWTFDRPHPSAAA
jgi:hypothetical protein